MYCKKEPEILVAECSRPLTFRPLTLADIEPVRHVLADCGIRTCDYSIGGIYMWADFFRYEFCIVRDTLFIKGVAENDIRLTAFSFPVGAMPPEEAVRMITDYCAARSLQPLFSAVPEEYAPLVASLTGGRAESLDDWSDYLYDAASLASLTGKCYSKKRNHVNRFMLDNPSYIFEPLTADLVPEVSLFLGGLDARMDDEGTMAEYERAMTARVLHDLGCYPFEGAVLRGECGDIVAFTVGEVIGDTLFVHIEKMNHEVDGAGETVNKLFAAYMLGRHPQVRYINREEDVGDPGLRRAKESYHPARLLRKFNVRVG